MKPVVDDVRKLYSDLGITVETEIDLQAIAFSLGAVTKKAPLCGCEARIIGLNDRAIITVNENSSPERQLFSIGHEIGHWRKHRGTIGSLCTKSEISEIDLKSGKKNAHQHREDVANAYASELIFPSFLLHPKIKGAPLHLDTASSVSSAFGASFIASLIRIIRSDFFLGFVAVYRRDGQRCWFQAHSELPYDFLPPRSIPSGSLTRELMIRGKGEKRAGFVDGEVWCRTNDASDACVYEESVHYYGDQFITLVWWQDEEPVSRLIQEKSGFIA